MKDYTKECWFCGQVTMVNKGNYYLCSSCGATWNPVPKPGASPVTLEDAVSSGSPRPRRDTHFRPSGVTTAKARKAREASGK